MAEAHPTENTPWGPEEAKKRCSKCGKTKPLDEFSPSNRKGKRPTRNGRCKSCMVANSAAWRKRQPDKDRANWRRQLLKEYGMTPRQYDEMLLRQGGFCAICRQPETTRTKAGKAWALHVDHDHRTGKIRGLLCNHCNKMLGHARDDLAVLRAALVYLEKSREGGDG